MMSKPWLDMSAYGAALQLVKLPSNSHFLVIRFSDEEKLKQLLEQAKIAGFQSDAKASKVLKKQAALQEGHLAESVLSGRFKKAFPLASVIDYDPEKHYLDRSDVALKSKPAEPLLLGINRHGHKVYEDDRGRYARDERGRITFENESEGASPGLFLRGSSPDAIKTIADAVVGSAGRGQLIGEAEFHHLVRVATAPGVEGFGKLDTIRPSTELLETYRRHIEIATAEWLTAKGGKTMQDAFRRAAELHDNLPFLRLNGRKGVGVGGSLAIAAQRSLGHEGVLRGQAISVVGDLPIQLLSRLPKSAEIAVSGLADGGEADFKRLAATVGANVVALASGAPKKIERFAIVEQAASIDRAGVKKWDTTFRRTDLARVVELLDARADNGVSIFVLDGPRDVAEKDEFVLLRSVLATRWQVEGEAHISAQLDDPTASAGAISHVLLSVGNRLPAVDNEAFPIAPREIHDWSTLWTWTASVVSERSRRETAASTVVTPEAVDLNKGEVNVQRNRFQAPYVSASKSAPPTLMVPRNLEGAVKVALERIVRLYGDIDAHVAAEYSYTVEELHEIFSPEQIDSLALMLHAEERDRSFLIGDETGVGKGRLLAAAMRRKAIKGITCWFLTEREKNFSDIWRDIRATKSEHLFNVMTLNSGAEFIDPSTNEVIFKGTSAEDLERIVASGKVPEGVNLVIGSYTQINRDLKIGGGAMSARSRFFVQAVDDTSALFTDEAHNGAGDSNTGDNLTLAIGRAGSVVFSSATFADKPENMAFYASLFPDSIGSEDLQKMMIRGGDTFAEVISDMLVRDGVMMRREFDHSKAQHETVFDTQRFERNRAIMDAVAPVLAEFAVLAGQMDNRITSLNDNKPEVVESEVPVDDAVDLAERRQRVKPFHVRGTALGSPLYVITRQFVAALKVDIIVEDAIKELEQGRKPVITVENTMGQLLEEVAEGADEEAKVDLDFRALFHRVLRGMVTVSWRDVSGARHKRDVTENDPALRAHVAQLAKMIDGLPKLPLSVIDEVKTRITAAGYTVGEITGRKFEVVDRRIQRRPKTNPVKINNQFNDGIIDVAIVNAKGATGSDMHAGVNFRDQRQRVMMELQPMSNVRKRQQIRGRVGRYDQVQEPLFKSYVSGLPIEMRLAIMEAANLRRLSAVTTSNRESAHLQSHVPDLMNAVGDIVCARYAAARPDMMRRMGFKASDIVASAKKNLETESKAIANLKKQVRRKGTDIESAEKNVVKDSSRKASEILARLIMLPVDVQTRVMDEITAEYRAAIEEMEARGETPLRTNEVSGIIHDRDSVIVEGAEMENPDSVFHEPLYMMKGALERTAVAISSNEIRQRIEIGQMSSGRARSCVDRIRNDFDSILEPFVPEHLASVAHALQSNSHYVVKKAAELNRLVEVLEQIRPGKGIAYTVDGEAVRGIVTLVDYPNRGAEHIPGAYGIEFVVPGDDKPRSMRIETLLRDKNFAINQGLDSDRYEEILKDFDHAVATKWTDIVIFKHNLYRAMRLNVEHNLGRLVTYTAPDGTQHRAIAASRKNLRLDNLPVEVRDREMAYDIVVNGNASLMGDNQLKDTTLSIRMVSNDLVVISLPSLRSRKYGYIYDNPDVAALLRLQGADMSRNEVAISKADFEKVIGSLYEAGAKFWTSPVFREWVNTRDQHQIAAPEEGENVDGDLVMEFVR